MSTNPIRVLIADAQPIVFEGLRSVLSHYSDIEVVADATDGVEAIDKAVHLEPDIVLLDVRMPRVDGLTVLRSIQTRVPRTKVILFASAESKDEFVGALEFFGGVGILFVNRQRRQPLLDALAELLGLGAQFGVTEALRFRLERVHLLEHRPQALQLAFDLGAKNLGEGGTEQSGILSIQG